MIVDIIKIGNSKGIRINKSVLEQCKISDKVEMTLKGDSIILKPVKKTRKGWDKAFKQMKKNGDDVLLLDDVFPDEEIPKWE